MVRERYDAVADCRSRGTNARHRANVKHGCKTKPLRDAYLDHAMMEAIMMRLISTIGVTLAFVSAGRDLWIDHAQASQGPGAMPGTAGTTAQLAMAIIVYGGSAMVIAVGLIGAARQRWMRGSSFLL
jgi:hypothetical protein